MPDFDRPKLLVIGHARHGKDTVCELLRDIYGFTFSSSSAWCSESVVFPAYKSWALGTKTPSYNIVEKHLGWPKSDPGWLDADACFNERSQHRALWFDLIAGYCRDDAARLARDIFRSNDIYAGIRSTREFHAARNEGVFDLCIWVDRSAHLPMEQKTSMQLEPWMADYVIDNNGSLDDLELEVQRLVDNRLGVRRPAIRE